MIQDTRITLYSIDRCGYYPWGKDIPEFGDLASTLTELQEWTRGKALGSTRTYHPGEGNLDPTYCFDIRRASATGDYLVITWNEIHSEEGGVPVVDPRSQVGNASVTFAPVPGNSIPGYATYFWLVPSRLALATVTFRNQRNGHQNFVRYINEFLAKFTRHVVPIDGGDSDLDIAGYRANTKAPTKPLIPSFRTTMVRRKAELDWIRDNRANITQILRKNLLVPTKSVDITFFKKLMTRVGVYGEVAPPADIKIRYEIAYTPSPEELDRIIDEWQGRSDTEWENVGFKVRGVQPIFWLNSAIVRQEFSLQVELTDSGVIEARSLLKALEAARGEILALL
jgi:hypothetical protein